MEQTPVRVLHVITGMGSGGAESFLMNMYRNIDREKVQFDFLLRSEENIYQSEIEAMGGRIYTTAPFPKQTAKNFIQIVRFFRSHSYKIVHVHANALLYMTALKEAKRVGVPCRIMHSHNTSMKYKSLRLLHEIRKKNIHSLATDCVACSTDAGKWMFGDNFSVIKNAVDIARFEFNLEARETIRKELGISERQFVVGHVGRMLEVKNHDFLFRVFAEILKYKPDALLLLVGTGSYKQTIEEKAATLGIMDRVKFLGVRKDVNRVMSVFDTFVFPSLYEGLPVVMVEAQANGLQIFTSEAIPDEAIVTPRAHKLQLADGAAIWAREILKADLQRVDTRRALVNAGFDIKTEAKKLEDFYLAKAKECDA